MARQTLTLRTWLLGSAGRHELLRLLASDLQPNGWQGTELIQQTSLGSAFIYETVKVLGRLELLDPDKPAYALRPGASPQSPGSSAQDRLAWHLRRLLAVLETVPEAPVPKPGRHGGGAARRPRRRPGLRRERLVVRLDRALAERERLERRIEQLHAELDALDREERP